MHSLTASRRYVALTVGVAAVLTLAFGLPILALFAIFTIFAALAVFTAFAFLAAWWPPRQKQ